MGYESTTAEVAMANAISDEIPSNRQKLPVEINCAYCPRVGFQTPKKSPRISGRKLKANINNNGIKKNTPSQSRGGRYSIQNVARRSIEFPLSRFIGEGSGVRGIYGAAFTSAHIAVHASRCSAVRFGVKLVVSNTEGSSIEKASFRVASVMPFITSWFECP